MDMETCHGNFGPAEILVQGPKFLESFLKFLVRLWKLWSYLRLLALGEISLSSHELMAVL